MKKYILGIILAFVIALCAKCIGNNLPVVGAPVSAMFIGMILSLFWKDKRKFQFGINFTAKKLLQLSIILLGFGMNISIILHMGAQSLPIIISTILASLVMAYIFAKLLVIDSKTAILIGVGSSICGGSAIAATAPVINADDETLAQSISVIFLFNIIAAIIFPCIGTMLGFSTQGFGIFAGTAINDTSSVTAAATAWDLMYGANALEIATIVKLTRTLAIIPITMILSIVYSRKDMQQKSTGNKKSFISLAPKFIILFVSAAVLTSVFNIPVNIINNIRFVSKFLIIMSLGCIGLNTDLIKLIKSGGKPILLGLICWVSIVGVSIAMQKILGYW